MRIGYKKVKTLIFDPKKLFLKWASVKLKSSLHLTPCHRHLGEIDVAICKILGCTLISHWLVAGQWPGGEIKKIKPRLGCLHSS